MAHKRDTSKKYWLDYCSGATGYGWSDEYDRLDEFESFIDQIRKEYTASVTVWDSTIDEFIFWKDTLTFEPRTDLLHRRGRDMRTSTRLYKEKQA